MKKTYEQQWDQDRINQKVKPQSNSSQEKLKSGDVVVETSQAQGGNLLDLINWSNNHFTSIDEKYVVGYDLGTSTHERVNATIIYPDSTTKNGDDASVLNAIAESFLPDNRDIQDAGLRKLEVSTKYCYSYKNNTSTMSEYRHTLFNYTKYNHRLLNGTVSLVGFNSSLIKLGEFVEFKYNKKLIRCKVESITEIWTYGGSIRTTLAVSHGFLSPSLTQIPYLTSNQEGFIFYDEAYKKLDPQFIIDRNQSLGAQ